VADELDLPIEFVLAFEEALGKVRPGPDDPAPADLPGMLGAPRRAIAAGVGADVELRLVRVFTDALSRVVETDANVFHRHIEMPLLDAGRSHGEMLDIVNEIGAELDLQREELVWAIYRRQQERVWTDDGVQHMESAIEAMGLYERTERPTAFAFLDLTGYTRLTEERGDEAAAELGARLAQLVHEEVGRRDGRAVKWLGDGVMFSFRDPAAAVLATIEVGRRTGEVGLPPAHAGVAAGPVIFQDGDYYGRTVNLASRLAGAAEPGQTLVDAEGRPTRRRSRRPEVHEHRRGSIEGDERADRGLRGAPVLRGLGGISAVAGVTFDPGTSGFTRAPTAPTAPRVLKDVLATRRR